MTQKLSLSHTSSITGLLKLEAINPKDRKNKYLETVKNRAKFTINFT